MRVSISEVSLHVDRFDCCARFSYARYAALELSTYWYIALFSLLKHGGFLNWSKLSLYCKIRSKLAFSATDIHSDLQKV